MEILKKLHMVGNRVESDDGGISIHFASINDAFEFVKVYNTGVDFLNENFQLEVNKFFNICTSAELIYENPLEILNNLSIVKGMSKKEFSEILHTIADSLDKKV